MKKLLLILLILPLFISCSNDDEYYNPVEGVWIADRYTDWDHTTIIYTFSGDFKSKLCTINKYSPDTICDPGGYRPYTVDKDSIYINYGNIDNPRWSSIKYIVIEKYGSVFLRIIGDDNYTDFLKQ